MIARIMWTLCGLAALALGGAATVAADPTSPTPLAAAALILLATAGAVSALAGIVIGLLRPCPQLAQDVAGVWWIMVQLAVVGCIGAALVQGTPGDLTGGVPVVRTCLVIWAVGVAGIVAGWAVDRWRRPRRPATPPPAVAALAADGPDADVLAEDVDLTVPMEILMHQITAYLPPVPPVMPGPEEGRSDA